MALTRRGGRTGRWIRRVVLSVVGLCAAGYGLALVAMWSGGTVPLEVWHTETLQTEFKAGWVDEIADFEGYLRLENRLFRELDERVYSEVETGPAQLLNRYSAGSAADPRSRDTDWNRSFELVTEDPVGGVLLLHGLTDAPYSLRALGQAFHRQGYWVLGLRLPGHGAAPSGLAAVHWRDMAAAVRLAAAHLSVQVRGGPVHIAGYSTGAPLALDFAVDALEGRAAPVPASLILVSPAIGVHPSAAQAHWKVRAAALPGLGSFAWLSVVPEFDPFKFNSFPTNAAAQVSDLTRHVAARIRSRAAASPENVLPPTLVFKSTVDATVTTDAVVDDLLARLAPGRHELVLFDINRDAVKSALMIADPAPLTDRVMSAQDLPFAVSFVTNETPDSRAVRVDTKPPMSREVTASASLGVSWPPGLVSLSHVALPFPPDDPLYGQRAPDNTDVLFLGEMALRGERGLLRFPENWLMRLRYNPFYDYLEARALDWADRAGAAGG